MVSDKEAQPDGVRELVAKGKERGFLTTEDILDALAPIDPTSEQIDTIYQMLQDENVEVVEMVDELDAEEFARAGRRRPTIRCGCTSRRSARSRC